MGVINELAAQLMFPGLKARFQENNQILKNKVRKLYSRGDSFFLTTIWTVYCRLCILLKMKGKKRQMEK